MTQLFQKIAQISLQITKFHGMRSTKFPIFPGILSYSSFTHTVKVVIFARSYFQDLPILNCFTCFKIRDFKLFYIDLSTKGTYSRAFIFAQPGWSAKINVAQKFPLLQYHKVDDDRENVYGNTL